MDDKRGWCSGDSASVFEKDLVSIPPDGYLFRGQFVRGMGVVTLVRVAGVGPLLWNFDLPPLRSGFLRQDGRRRKQRKEENAPDKKD
jgi:hypothetical protein